MRSRIDDATGPRGNHRRARGCWVQKNPTGGFTVRATSNGTIIAESDDTVVVEGNHYFPLSSVRADVLRGSDTHTICPWKGTASYYSIEPDGETNKDAAWFYPEPRPAAAEIVDRVAFWHGVQVSA